MAELAAQLSARGVELGQMREQVAAAQTELAQAKSDLGQTKSDLQQASERARDAAQAYDDALERAAEHAASLQRQLDHMGGSLRTFARVYLPHLSRYIRGRRS
jgi:uncharacterized protein YukE